MLRHILFAALALAAVPAMAQQVRSLGEGESSPPASIDDLAWLAGSWAGTGFGGESHESWLPPVNGRMAGIFHQSNGGEIRFYELLQLVPRDGSIVLRLKHFNADLSGWEDDSAGSAIEFPLVAIEGETAYFSGLTYQRVGEDGLRIYLNISRNGAVTTEAFELTRIE